MTKRARAATFINVGSPPYNASPSLADNTSNFQAALNALASAGGGVLQVPVGNYNLLGALSINVNGSLSIIGYGQELSVLVIQHAATALAVSLMGNSYDLQVRDIGFTPVPSGGGLAGTAISLSLPSNQSAWQNCLIENVDFGVPYAVGSNQYSAFTTVMNFTNVWQGKISNCNVHSNNSTGGTILSLNGTCIDNRINDCTFSGYTLGVSVNSYCEGIHLLNTTFIGGVAIATGSSNYNAGVNLLGLYVSGCEFNCTTMCMSLYQVSSGWISDNDFYGPRVGSGTVSCSLIGSNRLEISHNLFGGFFNTSSPTNQTAIAASNSSSASTVAILVNDCEFENTALAYQLGSGTQNFSAVGTRMFAPGNGSLINAPVLYGSVYQQVVNDASGNTTNTAIWLTTTTSTKATSARVNYSR